MLSHRIPPSVQALLQRSLPRARLAQRGALSAEHLHLLLKVRHLLR